MLGMTKACRVPLTPSRSLNLMDSRDVDSWHLRVEGAGASNECLHRIFVKTNSMDSCFVDSWHLGVKQWINLDQTKEMIEVTGVLYLRGD
eukprot:1161833-Pelagomonas_calceolata.AAC.21